MHIPPPCIRCTGPAFPSAQTRKCSVGWGSLRAPAPSAKSGLRTCLQAGDHWSPPLHASEPPGQTKVRIAQRSKLCAMPLPSTEIAQRAHFPLCSLAETDLRNPSPRSPNFPPSDARRLGGQHGNPRPPIHPERERGWYSKVYAVSPAALPQVRNRRLARRLPALQAAASDCVLRHL